MAERRQSAGENERPVREQDKVMLRLPDGMRDRLKAAAAANNRSMNAEIVSRIERYDSLGGEADALWEVARALAGAIDAVAGTHMPPLTDTINNAVVAVDMDTGEIDRAKIAREYGSEALKRLKISSASEEEPIFNIVLDAKGRPLDWPEVVAHVYRTAKAAGVSAVSFRTAVFSAARSDDQHGVEYLRLVRWYREQTRKLREAGQLPQGEGMK